MSGRKSQKNRIGCESDQLDATECVRVTRDSYKGKVELIRHDILDQFRRSAARRSRAEMNPWSLTMKLREEPGEVDEVEGLHDAETESTPKAADNRIHGVPGCFGGCKRSARFREENVTRLCQVDMVSGSSEEVGAQLLFEGLDRYRQCRLNEVKPARSAGEIPLFRDHHEVFETPQFHKVHS
jgi:hypothetical protein